ncbi:hypothetical protein M231_01297 [Tremella mesenterica]|uniref:Sugar phosphate transporter domain-containing protein n=1 Tax=Tremella mesenterica TaxID=5217 RepID=A0A4Q1BTV7_TREME|nr:hypothetical protein M231_01297 [Tremella mesenterica]
MSSVSSACHAVLIKRGLTTVQGSPVYLSYYNNLISTLILIPLIPLSGEMNGLSKLLSGQGTKTFIFGVGITGVFGFFISLASFLSIKVTSPVTHMISSASRGVLQTILAVWLFGDVMSQGRILGIILIISGSVLYVYAKERNTESNFEPPERMEGMLEDGKTGSESV